MIQPHMRVFFDQNLVLIHRVNWTDLDESLSAVLVCTIKRWETASVSFFVSHSSSDLRWIVNVETGP